MSRATRWSALLPALVLAFPAALADTPEVRSVAVEGRGEVRALPDRAVVTLAIEARDPALDPARGEADRVLAGLLKVARELRVADADLHSTALSVSPEYTRPDAKHARSVVAYVVHRQLVVELRNLEHLGELIERCITAGANVIGEPQLDSTRRADLEREAIARAASDARANATVLAHALDAEVGPARSASANRAGGPRAMPMAAFAAAGRAAATEAPETFETGELVFSATVNASFDLVPTRR